MPSHFLNTGCATVFAQNIQFYTTLSFKRLSSHMTCRQGIQLFKTHFPYSISSLLFLQEHSLKPKLLLCEELTLSMTDAARGRDNRWAAVRIHLSSCGRKMLRLNSAMS